MKSNTFRHQVFGTIGRNLPVDESHKTQGPFGPKENYVMRQLESAALYDRRINSLINGHGIVRGVLQLLRYEREHQILDCLFPRCVSVVNSEIYARWRCWRLHHG